MKKKLLLFSVLFFSVFSFYKYQGYKKENLALKLKLELRSKNKQKSLSWGQLKKIAKNKPLVTQKKNDEGEASLTSVEDESFESLIGQVELTLKNRMKIGEDDIEKGISAVDELISRRPHVYSSYKAKLILMITKESFLGLEVDEVEFSELLEVMSGFDITSDKVLRKEAFLIAQRNSRIEEVETSISALEDELLDVDDQEKVVDIESEIILKLDELEGLEDELEDGLLDQEDYLNEDIVEIPLYRSLARGNYDEVIDSSESLLEVFPSSIRGNFFLVRALELAGRKEESIDVIETSGLNESDLKKLELRLIESRKSTPEEYWKKLRF